MGLEPSDRSLTGGGGGGGASERFFGSPGSYFLMRRLPVRNNGPMSHASRQPFKLSISILRLARRPMWSPEEFKIT